MQAISSLFFKLYFPGMDSYSMTIKQSNKQFLIYKQSTL